MRRRNISLFRVARGRAGRKLSTFKPLLFAAAAGAVVASLITLAQASAIGTPTTEAASKLPRAIAAGAVMAAMAKWLGATTVTAGLTAGTGLYLLGIAKSATTPAGVAGYLS